MNPFDMSTTQLLCTLGLLIGGFLIAMTVMGLIKHDQEIWDDMKVDVTAMEKNNLFVAKMVTFGLASNVNDHWNKWMPVLWFILSAATFLGILSAVFSKFIVGIIAAVAGASLFFLYYVVIKPRTVSEKASPAKVDAPKETI